MDSLKHPATIIAVANTVFTAGATWYLYHEISAIKMNVLAIQEEIATLKKEMRMVAQQDQNKSKVFKETNVRIDTLSAESTKHIQQLGDWVNMMNADLNGLTEQLNNSGLNVQVELPSMASARDSYNGNMHFHPSQIQAAPSHPSLHSSPYMASLMPQIPPFNSTSNPLHTQSLMAAPQNIAQNTVRMGNTGAPNYGSTHIQGPAHPGHQGQMHVQPQNRQPYIPTQHPRPHQPARTGALGSSLISFGVPSAADNIGDLINLAQSGGGNST